MGSILKVKAKFFTDPKIVGVLNKYERTTLSRAGAMIRRTAQQSIRRSTRQATDPTGKITRGFQPSKPGTPPRTHSRGIPGLRDSIFFAYDNGSRSVVIGPSGGIGFWGKVAPVFEKGGSLPVLGFAKTGGFTTTIARYPKRSFMGPARDKALQSARFPKVFKDQLKA